MDEIRLIDANALKKALKSNCKPELCHDYNTAWCESCCQTNDFEDLIDDAPTFNPEITEKQAILFLINSGWIVNHDKELREKWERPHGEWNYIQAGMCVCPFCGAMPHDLYKDFCAKCGADMRPEKKLQTPSCLTNPERQAELLERYKEE